MDEYRIVYSIHVRKRMAERYISEEEVVYAISSGATIEVYADDTLHPSELLLCWSGSRPLHVVVAIDEIEKIKFIITAYEPDMHRWENNFRRRKQ